ncbi:MucB/RseB C-terminal domain-containing protein [Oceanisphaera sp. DM8]|uniref:MucB/RseB C-terminal domain-containing protein n=2 Tax=Oceanisphaera pacifica TaxID=2818389 RepID=A0ABS3NHS5_9GAMM|nr:MucB/RseB C-terminal domain-containing protein [Oceanisphaera pacifica]
MIIGLVTSSVMAEEDSAEVALQRMQQAYQQLNFELTLIEFSQGQLEPKRLTRGHLNGKILTHLTHLNGRPREFVQRDNKTSFFDANHSGYTLKGANLPGLFYRLQVVPLVPILEHYDAVFAGRSRVLGRVAQVVRLVPKEPGYYGYALWLDEESGLLVKLDTLSNHASVVEQSMGVALTIGEQPGLLINELATASLPPVMSVADVYPKPQPPLPWQLGWLPDGFELSSQDTHKLPITEQAVDYLMLSNGLVEVSVYIAKAGRTNDLNQQLVRQGATHLLSLVNNAQLEVTVVGAIPADTARKIAESITAKHEQNVEAQAASSPKSN